MLHYVVSASQVMTMVKQVELRLLELMDAAMVPF